MGGVLAHSMLDPASKTIGNEARRPRPPGVTCQGDEGTDVVEGGLLTLYWTPASRTTGI